MRKDLFQPTLETEARLLLLINGFTSDMKSLEGRTKLTKLDFFVRYPVHFERALQIRAPSEKYELGDEGEADLESKMIRFRYGPWDPSYFAVLGRLIGKGLIITVPSGRGLGYRATPTGITVAKQISHEPHWKPVVVRIKLLKRHFDLTGSRLKEFIYKNFPDVAGASWGDKL